MIKIKGVEQPISLLKIWVPDITLSKLDQLKVFFKVKTDAEMLVSIIESSYDFVDRQLKKMVEAEAVKVTYVDMLTKEKPAND